MHFFSEFFHIFTTTAVWRLISSLHAFSWTAFTDMEYAVGNRQGGAAARVSKVMSCQ